MTNYFYSEEDGCYYTYPDGDKLTYEELVEILKEKEQA